MKYFFEKEYPRLSIKDQNVLITKAKSGDRSAVEKIIFHNQGLVRKVAGRYRNTAKNYLHMDSFNDLISIANIGLMSAINGYEKTKGKFSTYAGACMKHELEYGLEEMRHIYLPSNHALMLRSIYKTQDVFYVKNGRFPTDEEVSKIIGKRGKKISENKIRDLLNISTKISTRTLSDKFSDNGGNNETLADILDNQNLGRRYNGSYPYNN